MAFTLYGYEVRLYLAAFPFCMSQYDRRIILRPTLVLASCESLSGLPAHETTLSCSLMFTFQAAAEGIELNHFEVIPRMNIGKDEYMAKFPLSMGKIPGLEGPHVLLTETMAITTVSLHT